MPDAVQGSHESNQFRSALFLLVTVPDALPRVGDGHAVRDDGDVGGTAIRERNDH